GRSPERSALRAVDQVAQADQVSPPDSAKDEQATGHLAEAAAEPPRKSQRFGPFEAGAPLLIDWRQREDTVAGHHTRVPPAHPLDWAPLGDLHVVDERDRADLGVTTKPSSDALPLFGVEVDRYGVGHPLDMRLDRLDAFPHSRRRCNDFDADG